MKSNWEKFQTNHESLLDLCSAEYKKLSYFKDDLYSRCEEEFFNAHGVRLDTFVTLNQDANQNAPNAEAALNSSFASRSRRLPRIDVPKFSGDYAQWSHFRDLFTSMIIENPDISTVEKLHPQNEPLRQTVAASKKYRYFRRKLYSRWDVARYDNKMDYTESLNWSVEGGRKPRRLGQVRQKGLRNLGQ